MAKKQKGIEFNLTQIANDGLQEKFDQEMKKLADNILDPNTEAKKVRKVQLELKYTPTDNREVVSVEVAVKSTLAPQKGVTTSLMLGRNQKGSIEGSELRSGAKNQTYIDENAELRTDKGELIDENGEIKKNSGVIDFRKQKQN
ncbi:hypothetical protein [Loigolactobacillus bifermentans]|uniref:Replication terminator protein n=1 Tax=Loigolactobacillus bifermentans DSM 20003 TaxID=1423726 RepID=A0A0R1H350_9LACO|nr:hypothetical protein [Loigolactobacillus bifermentans]KRK40831.1 hypothetical protein FC07_GL002581 [Loigolactobacillus bifermentans DSM 20003]QGG59585.1 hypothetical protein LB003_03305 [Loigolactobacillus bifermentans]